MIKQVLFLLTFSISSLAFSQEQSIKENLEYLTSDDLKGRENGSPELLECGQWIASQFRDMGLQSPSFCDDYLQKITLLKVRNIYKTLFLNTIEISDESFFTLGQFERISVNSTSEFKIFFIGEDDDINTAFFEIKNFTSSYAVFVHPIHKRRFERFKQYFTRENLELEHPLKSYSLWVLTDEEKIDDIQLVSRNDIVKTELYNVIGTLPSKKGEDRKWIFSAHYDHIGILENIGADSIANGANDDASGVIAVLELAKKFSTEPEIDKTIYFIAFAGEELGLLGSKYLATQINLDSIEAMVNIEMIGIPNIDLGPESAYISGYDLSYLPEDMSKNVDPNKFMLFPDPYPYLNLFKRSDNVPFAAYGIPAHSVSTYSEDDITYHTVNDNFELLDLDHIISVIDAIFDATLPLLSLDYDPGIIDYKTKNDR